MTPFEKNLKGLVYFIQDLLGNLWLHQQIAEGKEEQVMEQLAKVAKESSIAYPLRECEKN